MFLRKFFYFLKGYVIIELDGKSALKFINELTRKGIVVYNVFRGDSLCILVLEEDLEAFKKIARDSKAVEYKILKAFGFKNYLKRYKKRILFPVGAIFFVLFFAISTRFLWFIKIEGNNDISNEEITAVLSELGIKKGALISSLPDGKTIKNHLTTKLDNVPWAWVYFEGISARVVIHEGIVSPVVMDDSEPCDIVSARDGIIVKMSVKKGEAVCQSGGAVASGDVLISGFVKTGDYRDGITDEPSGFEVHADGTVLALTHHEKTSYYDLFEERPSFTGKHKNVFTITYKNKSFSIFGEPKYSYYIKYDNAVSIPYTPITITKSVYNEAEKNTVQLPEDWVLDFAKRDLSAQISNELGAFSTLKEEEVQYTKENNRLKVTLKMDFIENIGVCVPRS